MIDWMIWCHVEQLFYLQRYKRILQFLTFCRFSDCWIHEYKFVHRNFGHHNPTFVLSSLLTGRLVLYDSTALQRDSFQGFLWTICVWLTIEYINCVYRFIADYKNSNISVNIGYKILKHILLTDCIKVS